MATLKMTPGFALVAALATSVPASAQISDNVVKIGVLTDMNGPASTATGKGSLTAAQMAIDDFGKQVAHFRRPSEQARHRRHAGAAVV
jgi:branched-chain amino acid transport system substrate-binding protein